MPKRAKRPEEPPVKSSVEHTQELQQKLAHLKSLIVKVEARLEERLQGQNLRNTAGARPD